MKKVLVLVALFLMTGVISASDQDFNTGMEKFNNGEYILAEQIFRDLVREQPYNPAYLQMLAKTFMVWNRYDEAEELLLRARERSGDKGITLELIDLYLAQGKPARALSLINKLYEEGLDMSEQEAEALYQQGLRSESDGNITAAVEYFESVRSLRPHYRDIDQHIEKLNERIFKGKETGAAGEGRNLSRKEYDLRMEKLRALEAKRSKMWEEKMKAVSQKEAEVGYKAFKTELELQKKMAELKTRPESASGLSANPPKDRGRKVGTVWFASGKSELDAVSRTMLERIVKQIQPGNSLIIIVGHTDPTPFKTKKKDNIDLSAFRALAVKRYLVGRGVDKKRIEVYAVGPLEPISRDNAKNRRTEIYVR